ncbi:MAG: enoyl-CoA hydratase/isomerase family protein [Actinomycetota bacterium]|nr:enoyl-CoA hydratase/isomerase family protein [Actinomycetota bacterium]MDA2971431.1 enoyl-CoA hydratase/isomerase family protein [Actinomycetota bacterium]MDA3002336.1 enoyl-CoA hydratase/isomerase family protein [Actinomycetota bacterium]
MPSFENLRVDESGSIATISLHRPHRLNALSRDLLGEIVDVAAWLHDRNDLRVVIVRGSNGNFSAGFDLDDFVADAPSTSPRESADLGRRATEALARVPQITIAAVDGHCIGGGLVLVSACDLRYASETARFRIPEVDLGIPLAWGGIPRLVREIGPALTKELVLTCRLFDALEAMSIGFLNGVVQAEDLTNHVEAVAQSLASKPLYALRTTKNQVEAVMDEIASTAHSTTDADVLAYALRDPESREVSKRYLAERRNT